MFPMDRPAIWITGITEIEFAGHDVIESLPFKKIRRFEAGNDSAPGRDPFPFSWQNRKLPDAETRLMLPLLALACMHSLWLRLHAAGPIRTGVYAFALVANGCALFTQFRAAFG
jgi:hypothetical protein